MTESVPGTPKFAASRYLLRPLSTHTQILVIICTTLALVPRASAQLSTEATTLEIALGTLSAIFILCIAGGWIEFERRRRKRRRALHRTQVQAQVLTSPVPNPQEMITPFPLMPLHEGTPSSIRAGYMQLPTDDSRGDLLVGPQRAPGLELHQLPQLQVVSGRTVQISSNNPSLDLGTPSAEQHRVSAEQNEAPESAMSSDGVPTLAGVVSPYTYRNYDHRPTGQDTPHLTPPMELDATELVPPYADPTPGEFEEMGNYSPINPSEVSFGDSVSPPDYQSTWGGEAHENIAILRSNS